MEKRHKLKQLTSFSFKYDLKMKLTTLFLIVSLFQLQANESYAQKTKVTLNLENVSLENVFDKIESLTEFKFFFNYNEYDYKKKVSVMAKKEKVSSILKRLFKKSDISFQVIDKQIVLSNKKTVDNITKKPILTIKPQGFKVSGTVLDANSQPLPGANILEKGTTNGTQTDFDGNFSIEVANENAILVISFIGFKTQEVAAGEAITVTLVEDAASLDEIVVTGYTGQSKRTITGAVETIDSEELIKTPATSVEQQLQGKISGVNIITSGEPGSGSQVRIRGFSTIGNNKDPLYIIDGSPGGGLNDINPDDIETVSVLKDGSAASIYGSRAANGVIIITTKKGRKNQPLTVAYNTWVSLDSDGSKPQDVLNAQQWGELEFQGQRAGGNASPSHPSYGNGANPVIPEFLNGDPSLPYDPDTNRLLRSGDTDWYDVVTQAAVSQNHNLSFRGGSERGTYALSFGYLDRQGTIIENSFQRYTTRINTQFSFLNDRIRIGENLTVAYSERNGNGGSDALFRRNTFLPLIPEFDEGGNFGGTLNGILGLGTNARSPHAVQIRLKDAINRRMRIFGNAFVEADILSGLTLKSNIAIDYTHNTATTFSPVFVEGGNPGNAFFESANYNNFLTWTNSLNYTKNFGDHRVTAFGGTEIIEFTRRNINFSGTGFFIEDPNLISINAASVTNSISGTGGLTRKLSSLFGKLDYAYKDKYFVNFTIRRDGASFLGPNNRFDIFPAVGAGWLISDEGFLENSNTINFLKLRAGWGQVGNINTVIGQGDFPFASLFGSDPGFTSTGYDIGGTNQNPPANGIALLARGNDNLLWETSETLNIGVDFTLFNNKISGSLEWYKKNTIDLIQRLPLPLAGGTASAPFGNVGEIENKGVDVTLSYNGTIGDEFEFGVSGIVTAYKNKVIDLNGNPATFIPTDIGNPRTITSRTVVGGEIGAFYGLIVDGVIQTGPDAGNFDFRDLNGDGNINLDDSAIIGSPHPDFTYSLNLTANYKNFDFSAFFRGSQGNDLFNYSKLFTDFHFRDLNRSTRVLNAWRPDNPTNTLAEYNVNTAGLNSRGSSYYVEDGSYLRLQTLQIGYTFPEIPGVKNLRVYLQGQNIFTITDYLGGNPELGERNGVQIGIDEGATYGTPRSFLLGLNLTL